MINARLLRVPHDVVGPAAEGAVVGLGPERVAQSARRVLVRELGLGNVVQVLATRVEGPVEIHAARTGLNLAH